MKKFLSIMSILMIVSCKSQNPQTVQVQPEEFKNIKGCFLLYDLKSQKLVKRLGESCEIRYPACSTFKVPLAVMAFDSGVLKDEKQVLKWDGQKRFLDQWNKDHNAQSWMFNSVVWFSQKLTPMIGEEKVKTYLQKFEYGNEDLSAGLTEAWLVSPSKKSSALTISSHEQLEFMQKLWTDKLPASSRALQLARDITYLETSPKGYKLSGKTGSNFYDDEKKVQLGWFIAHISNGKQEYLSVTNINDLKPYEGTMFGGARAKEITKSLLAKEGLW